MLLLAACSRPPVLVVERGGTVVVDVQTLGEYPTTVERIRLLDAGGRVVWHIQAPQTSQIRTLELRAGENSVHLDADRPYDVIVPRNRSTFTVRPGAPYVVEICGGTSWWSCNSEELVAPPMRAAQP